MNSKKKNSNPTMKDVAKEAGVSLGTVSKVFNDVPVGASYRRKVEEAAERLHYQVNNYARGLKTNETRCIALLIPSLQHPFFSALTDEITAYLMSLGYRNMLMITNYDQDAEEKCITLVQQNKVDGIIGLTYIPALEVDPSVPFVTIDRHLNSSIPCVSSDNYQGGQLATDEYASNEFGDGVTQLGVDSLGCLVLVSDRYVRLYDPVRRTLRQQSREEDGVYSIELQETQPDSRWSQPEAEVVERMPLWVWYLLVALILILTALVTYIWQLHRQRKRFLASMKDFAPAPAPEESRENISSAESAESNRNEAPIRESEAPWLQQAITQVEAHISDDSYNVEQLASDLCMSRMTFYRKIQSATGQKPTEFIRTIRLRRAAELLREGRMTVTEVSYATGFSSVSYFSRCFRTMFGVPPTNFSKTGSTSFL